MGAAHRVWYQPHRRNHGKPYIGKFPGMGAGMTLPEMEVYEQQTRPAEPTAADLLESLHCDFTAADTFADAGEMAEEYEYTDVAAALRAWQGMTTNRKALLHLFSRDEISELCACEEE